MEIFAIGRHHLDPRKYSHNIQLSIKILGIAQFFAAGAHYPKPPYVLYPGVNPFQ